MIMDGWVGSPENAMDDTRKMTEIDMGGVVIALDNIDDNGLPYVTKALAKRIVRQAIGVKLPLRGPVTINGKIEQRQYVNRGQAGIFKGCFGGHRIVTNRHNFALKQGEKPRGCAVGIHIDMINDSEDEYILSFKQEHHQDNLYPLKWPDPTLKWTWPFGDDVLWARWAKVNVGIPACEPFQMVRRGFKIEPGQQIALAACYWGPPNKADMERAELVAAAALYGKEGVINIYTGVVTEVTDHAIFHDINTSKGFSGACIFLGDGPDQLSSVTEKDYGKVIAVHTGHLANKNYGFKIRRPFSWQRISRLRQLKRYVAELAELAELA